MVFVMMSVVGSCNPATINAINNNEVKQTPRAEVYAAYLSPIILITSVNTAAMDMP